MTHTASFVWKDLRGLRWELAVWLALNALVAGSWKTLAGLTAGPGGQFYLSLSLVPILQWLAGVYLAFRIVQTDPLVGTTAAWRTRPLGRGSWMAAKLLLVGSAVVIVPASSDAFVALSVGMRSIDAALAAIVGAAWITVWAVPAAAIGAITPSLSRAALVGAGVAVFTLLRIQVSSALRLTVLPFASVQALQQSQALAWCLVLVAGALGVIVHQVLTFRTRRSRVLAAAVLVCATLVGDTWRWDLSELAALAFDHETDAAVIDTRRITLAFEPGSGRETSVHARGRSRELLTSAAEAVTIAGLPDGAWADVVGATTTVRSRDGSVVTTAAWPYSTTRVEYPGIWQRSDPRVASVARALRGATLVGGSWALLSVTRTGPILIRAPEHLYARLAQASVTVSSEVRLRAFRYREATRAAARPGNRLTAARLSVEVLEVEPTPTGDALMRLRCASLRRLSASEPVPMLALVNVGRREAYVSPLGSPQGPWLRPGGPTALVLDVGAPAVAFTPGWVGPDGKWQDAATRQAVDAAWLDGAELVLLEPEYLGSFTTHLEVDGYRLPRSR